MHTVAELEARLTQPSAELIADLATLEGDLLVLGAGGKMGPSLVTLAQAAMRETGRDARVYAVSRFSQPGLREALAASGAIIIAADLLVEGALEQLPDAANVIYMAGTKFGTSGNEHLTWAQNTLLPGLVGRRFSGARVVAFSTGNVYPFVPIGSGGSSEESPVGPVGEYAQSCLGRERLFEHASFAYNTQVVQFRLNYAVDLRYGVLLDVAQAVYEGRPIDLTMGYVNVIWQGDANEMALRSLGLCSAPPNVLNVTGPETISVRWLAERFGELLQKAPRFAQEEQDTALLSNASKAHGLFGYPRVTLRQMIAWTAEWVRAGGETLGKPTHFGERKGQF